MIYFCYRDTINWKQKSLCLDFFVGRKQLKNPKKQQKEFELIIDKWNKVNEINYFEFRNILKNISKRTFDDANIEEVFFEDILKLNDNDWIIPFDDDDWFCKSFKKNIEHLDDDVNFVYGDVSRYFIHEGKFQLDEGIDEKCKILQSCQYAVRIKKLKEISPRSSENIIKTHYSVVYEIQNNKIKSKYINNTISSRIMHNGQHSVLFKLKDLDIKNYFKFDSDIPFFSFWSKPYINMLKYNIKRRFI